MSFDWSQFYVTMYYREERQTLYQRWASAAGLESFFIAEARHQAPDGRLRDPKELVQTGDTYAWNYVHDFKSSGQFTLVQPNEQISFSFGSMHVSIRFRDVRAGTEVRLHQTNCASTDPDRAWQHLNCRSCWIYFFTNLRSVLMTGTDLRDHENPELNDSVSIGWDPSKAEEGR